MDFSKYKGMHGVNPDDINPSPEGRAAAVRLAQDCRHYVNVGREYDLERSRLRAQADHDYEVANPQPSIEALRFHAEQTHAVVEAQGIWRDLSGTAKAVLIGAVPYDPESDAGTELRKMKLMNTLAPTSLGQSVVPKNLRP